jgi:paraquat-inducible protein B
MSQRANPTVIGAFVVGAVFLAIGGLLLFGSGKVFHRVRPFVLYLDDDVGGLSVGSAVRFQGVQVGSVTGIRLLVTREGAARTIIPVTILLDESLIESKSGTAVDLNPNAIHRAIDEGLRARLETESLITGQRCIQLSIAPDTPARLRGFSTDMEEIPTIPGSAEEMRKVFERLQNVDLGGMVTEVTATSRALREMLEAPETKGLPASLRQSIDSVDRLVETLHEQVEPTLESIRETAKRTTEVEGELSKTLVSARGLLDPESPLVVQLQTTLKEFGATARSLRALTELVERDPSVLVRGKGVPSKP